MKRMIAYSLCFLLFFTALAFADKIMISGKAVVLEPVGDYYYFPDSYHRNAHGYHFVYVHGTYRVCHLNPQKAFSHLDLLRVQIELHGQRFIWNCYVYDPRFFEIDF